MTSGGAIKVLRARLGQVPFNAFIVAAYKVGGFTILAAILAGMLSYLATSGFFVFDRSWMAPAILSPTDDRVLKITSQIADESARRELVVSERRELAVRCDQERRTVAMETSFQESVRAALASDIDDRRADLAGLEGLIAAHAAARAEILRSHAAYAGLSRERLAELFAARVIDQDGLVNGSYQLAQIANSDLVLDESEANLDIRIRALTREVGALRALAALLSSGGAGAMPSLSYDVARIKQLYDKSVLESERARSSGDALEKNVAALDATIAIYDGIIAALNGSPYLKAANHEIAIAFVPYENVENVPDGAPVYGCLMGFVWCDKVGSVSGMLDGEAQERHPVRNLMLRGQLVRLDVDGTEWARRPVLYAKKKPLLF